MEGEKESVGGVWGGGGGGEEREGERTEVKTDKTDCLEMSAVRCQQLARFFSAHRLPVGEKESRT